MPRSSCAGFCVQRSMRGLMFLVTSTVQTTAQRSSSPPSPSTMLFRIRRVARTNLARTTAQIWLCSLKQSTRSIVPTANIRSLHISVPLPNATPVPMSTVHKTRDVQKSAFGFVPKGNFFVGFKSATQAGRTRSRRVGATIGTQRRHGECRS